LSDFAIWNEADVVESEFDQCSLVGFGAVGHVVGNLHSLNLEWSLFVLFEGTSKYEGNEKKEAKYGLKPGHWREWIWSAGLAVRDKEW
jgi:hypothetical protein